MVFNGDYQGDCDLRVDTVWCLVMFFTWHICYRIAKYCKISNKLVRMLISFSVALWRGCICSCGLCLEHGWQTFANAMGVW